MAHTIELPVNAVESATAYFWVDADGVIHIFNKRSLHHGVRQATENVETVVGMSNGAKMLLLIDISNIRSIDRETREKYATAGDTHNVGAIALVTRSQISKMVGNFFLSFNKPKVPTKLFNNSAAAKRWLLSTRSNPVL